MDDGALALNAVTLQYAGSGRPAFVVLASKEHATDDGKSMYTEHVATVPKYSPPIITLGALRALCSRSGRIIGCAKRGVPSGAAAAGRGAEGLLHALTRQH